MKNLLRSIKDFSKEVNTYRDNIYLNLHNIATRKHINIYTDGSLDIRTRKGGYAAVLNSGNYYVALTNSIPIKNTTVNRMEMMAVIAALRYLKSSSNFINLYIDSETVIDGIQLAPLRKKNDWIKNRGKKSFADVDLWEILLPLNDKHQIKYHKVTSGCNSGLHMMAHDLANRARKRSRQVYDNRQGFIT